MSLISSLNSLKGAIPRRSLSLGELEEGGLDGNNGGVSVVAGSSLHLFRLSSYFLLGCALFATSANLFGNPIHCEAENKMVDPSVYQSFCWMKGSYFAPPSLAFQNTRSRQLNPEQKREIKYQNYYQWIPVIYLSMAALLYFPYYYWIMEEAFTVRSIIRTSSRKKGGVINHQQESVFEITEQLFHFYPSKVARRIYQRLGHNDVYALKFVLALVFGFLSLLLQYYLLNFLVRGDFASLGTHLWNLFTEGDAEKWYDFETNPLVRLFPTLIHCVFDDKLGFSGSFVLQSSLCVLPTNNFNEKVFAFLWFWYVFLFIFTSVEIIFQIFFLFCPAIRKIMIYYYAKDDLRLKDVDSTCRKMKFGDWFLLNQFRKCMDRFAFRFIIIHFVKEFNQRDGFYRYEIIEERDIQ